MSVVHVIESAGPGGAETVLAGLVHARLAKGRQVLAVIPSAEGWLGRSLPAHAQHVLRATPREASGFVDWNYLRRLRELFATRRPEVVHAHSFDSAFYCALALTGLPTRFIATFHGASDVTRFGLKNRAKWLMFGRADALVCVSASLRQAAERTRGLPGSHLRTIYNGVDLSKLTTTRSSALRTRLALSPRTRLVGALGNIRAPKGYDLLLGAVARLRSEGMDLHLAIAGDERGALAGVLREQRTALGLDEAVSFVGFVDDPGAFLAGIDLFVLSSTSEGFSLSTVQAMASALPIVATRSGGPQELIVHDEHGWLVDAGSIPALADGLRMLLHDAPRGERLAAAAHTRALETFSVDRMFAAYDALYAEVLLR